MRRFRSFARAAGFALGVAAFLGSPAARAADKDQPAANADDKSSKSTLAPDVEAKVEDFIAKTKVEKIKNWNVRMSKIIDNVAKATGLGDDGKKALETAAQPAVAAAIGGWESKSLDTMQKEVKLMPPEQANMMLAQRLPQYAAFAQADWIPGVVLPFEEKEWSDGLKQTLTPDQLAAWQKSEDDRKAAIEKEMADLLKNGVDRTRTQQTQQILSECTGIELAVGLSKDRAAKLEDLGKSVVDKTVEMWRSRVEKMMLTIDDTQREEFVGNGNIFIGTDDDEVPMKQAAWTDGVAHFLTADEVAHMKDAKDARKSKRVHVMGQMMIVLLDERVAFTEAQRQRLQPVADRIVKDMPEISAADPDDGENMNCSPGIFYSASRQATDAELKPILDDVQLKRWRHLSESTPAPHPPHDGNSVAAQNLGPEDIEKAISLFLYDKSEKERKRMFDLNVLKAEDAVRVAGLNADTAARLEAAARGATEESLISWKWFTEQQVRSQLQEVTPQNVQQRLDSLQDYMFFQRNFGQFNRQSLWDDTLKTALTAPQQAAWKKETDARAAYSDDAIATMVLSDFENENEISSDQWAKLLPLVAKIVHDYSPDIDQIFSPNNPVPWYMQGSYAFLPIAGISDTDLKSVLTKDQVDRWHSSGECGNVSGLWQNIQQMHNQRAGANR